MYQAKTYLPLGVVTGILLVAGIPARAAEPATTSAPAAPVAIEKPLLAYWTFDEAGGAVSGSQWQRISHRRRGWFVR